jgi:hypothetical protein
MVSLQNLCFVTFFYNIGDSMNYNTCLVGFTRVYFGKENLCAMLVFCFKTSCGQENSS